MEGLVNSSFWENKKVLVTGNTGFKGSWLSLWLQKLKAEVIGFALKPCTNPSMFEVAKVSQGMTSIEGDIRNFDHIASVVKEYKPEIIFHLAAQPLVLRSYRYPLETYSTNVMGTAHLFESVRLSESVRVIINVTSDKCYENRESNSGYREIDPLGGFDPYSSSKGCSELITSAYRNSFFNPKKYKEHGVALASVRAGNIIGGGDWSENRIVSDIMRAWFARDTLVVRSPDAIRPWQHVLDPLLGYVILAQNLWDHGTKFSGSWNFGSDAVDCRPVSWIVEKTAELWGECPSWKIEGNPFFHETKTLKLDSTKAKDRLNWYAKWNLETTLDKTVDWFKCYKNNQNMQEVTLKQIDEHSIFK
tara:strand:- start:2068 stop:3150 length:1083 start_codon:yes stop_codon:yes gene_type:complete